MRGSWGEVGSWTFRGYVQTGQARIVHTRRGIAGPTSNHPTPRMHANPNAGQDNTFPRRLARRRLRPRILVDTRSSRIPLGRPRPMQTRTTPPRLLPSPVRIPHTPGTPNPGTHTPGITTTRPSQNLPINLTHHALLIDILTAGPLEVEESAIETRDAGAGGGGVAMFPRGAVVGCWWGFGREGLFVCLHHRAGDAGAGAVGGMALEFVVVALAAAAAEKAEGHEGEQAERGGRGCPDPGRCLGLVCGSWCAIG